MKFGLKRLQIIMPDEAFQLIKGAFRCVRACLSVSCLPLYGLSGMFLRLGVSISSENPDMIMMTQCNDNGRFACQSNISVNAHGCCRACVRAVVWACVCMSYKHKNNLHKIIFTLLFWLFQFFRITLTL